ncbi:MAG: RsiV family protein [Pseudomonadota bacterium]
MSLLKFASMTCIALTLGACQSMFQPSVQKPLAFTHDRSEQLKAGCSGLECPLVNIDTVHFADEPKLDALIEKRLLKMTVYSPDEKIAPSLNAYREQFLRTADSRNSSYLQAKVREQHDGLVIVELSSYLDTGGAHGMPGRGFINYSRQEQKEVTLQDMLVPGQEDAFWGAGKVAHNNWLISTRFGNDPEFVKNWPFQKTPHVALTENFVILKYDVYSIAPYSEGHVELKIPYARLKGILKPEWFPGQG